MVSLYLWQYALSLGMRCCDPKVSNGSNSGFWIFIYSVRHERDLIFIALANNKLISSSMLEVKMFQTISMT